MDLLSKFSKNVFDLILQGSAGISEVYHSKWNPEASKGKFFRFDLDPNCQTLYDVFRRGLKISSELSDVAVVVEAIVKLIATAVVVATAVKLIAAVVAVVEIIAVYVVVPTAVKLITGGVVVVEIIAMAVVVVVTTFITIFVELIDGTVVVVVEVITSAVAYGSC
jgi:hypothetical protein